MSEKRIIEGLRSKKIKRTNSGQENVIQGWWFEDRELRKAKKYGKLLTLDLDLGKFCDLRCGFCFADTQSTNNCGYVLQATKRAKFLIKEAKNLGCRSIKIVGAGEPLLFPKLLEVLRFCQKLEIVPIIFTAGHIFGDDHKARNVFRGEKIKSGKDLAETLYNLNCSIIVKYLTHDDKLQDKMVNRENYAQFRDKGLVNLIEARFNSSKPTRLGVDCLLLKSNHQEALRLFSFFNRLNIFCVLNTSMDCGNTKIGEGNPEVLNKSQALKIAKQLYVYCSKKNIPFDRRISPYFLSPACSQLNHGLFIGDNNSIKACPGGPEIGTYQCGNLAEIWKENTFRQCKIAHKCISRCGKTYYSDFEERVRKALRKK